jgi:CheY-like chemotaxis protein
MPPAPNWQVVDQVLDDPATANIPLLICSGSLEELQPRAAWLEARSYDTLLKPFRAAALLVQVQRRIGGPAPDDPDLAEMGDSGTQDGG